MSSLVQKFTNRVLPILVGASTAFAAVNAQAECLPGSFDAQRGIQAKDCYTTPEINKAMAAYNQKTRITAERAAMGANSKGVYGVGIHNRWTSTDDGKIGFNLEGDAPTGQPQKEWYVRTVMQDVRIWDRDMKVIPSVKLVGAPLMNGIEKSGDQLMLSARSGNGYYVVVARPGVDFKTEGGFLVGNNQKVASLAALANPEYTAAGRAVFVQPPFAAADVTAPAVLLAGLKP